MSHYQIASHSRLAKFWFDQIGSSSRLHFFARLGEIPDWPDWTQILIGQIAWESRLDIVGRFFDFQIAFISRLAHFSRLVPNPDWHDIAQQGRQRRQGHHAAFVWGTISYAHTPWQCSVNVYMVLVRVGVAKEGHQSWHHSAMCSHYAFCTVANRHCNPNQYDFKNRAMLM